MTFFFVMVSLPDSHKRRQATQNVFSWGFGYFVAFLYFLLYSLTVFIIGH